MFSQARLRYDDALAAPVISPLSLTNTRRCFRLIFNYHKSIFAMNENISRLNIQNLFDNSFGYPCLSELLILSESNIFNPNYDWCCTLSRQGIF